MIASALNGSGAEVDVLPVAADDEDSHRAAIERGLQADVLVTSGGVSMGPHDPGGRRSAGRRGGGGWGGGGVCWGVAVKPGKPLAFGVRGSTLVFGLPGNPVSSLVGALLFRRPALPARRGAAHPQPWSLDGRLSATVRRNPQRDEYVRARRLASTDGARL